MLWWKNMPTKAIAESMILVFLFPSWHCLLIICNLIWIVFYIDFDSVVDLLIENVIITGLFDLNKVIVIMGGCCCCLCDDYNEENSRLIRRVNRETLRANKERSRANKEQNRANEERSRADEAEQRARQQEIAAARHPNRTCDGCNEHPIRGMRYKCDMCYDFDLCRECYTTISHPRSHRFLKIKPDL